MTQITRSSAPPPRPTTSANDVPDMAVLPVRRPCLSRTQCIALVLLICGAVELGIEGLFAMDLIAQLMGTESTLARTIRIVIGLAGVYGIRLLILFRPARLVL